MFSVQEMCLNTPQEAHYVHGVKCKGLDLFSLTEEPVSAFCKSCSVPLAALHFAVLCTVLRLLQKALTRERVPFVLVKDVSLMERVEVKDTLAYIR